MRVAAPFIQRLSGWFGGALPISGRCLSARDYAAR